MGDLWVLLGDSWGCFSLEGGYYWPAGGGVLVAWEGGAGGVGGWSGGLGLLHIFFPFYCFNNSDLN